MRVFYKLNKQILTLRLDDVHVLAWHETVHRSTDIKLEKTLKYKFKQ